MPGTKVRVSVVMTLVLVLLMSALPAGAQGGDFELTVLHTNDVHAPDAKNNYS